MRHLSRGNGYWKWGDSMIRKAIQMARFFGNIPEESTGYPTRKLRFLVRICYQLQQAAGQDPFYLSWNQAASALQVSPSCAGGYLGILLGDGIIEVVEEHTETEATRYRYIGKEGS